MWLLQGGATISKAVLLSAKSTHGFLLTIAPDYLVAVKAGFRSGYAGEGPAGLAFILKQFQLHRVEVHEIDVAADVLTCLNDSKLAESTVKAIQLARPVAPQRLEDYTYGPVHSGAARIDSRFKDNPVVPFSIIDSRIMDLAISFWDDPDAKLMSGYRLLEERIRERTQLQEHGAQLFSAAMLPPKAPIDWPGLPDNEKRGRAQLFTSTFMAYRNARAHRNPVATKPSLLIEFLLLNHLFLLEKHSADVEK